MLRKQFLSDDCFWIWSSLYLASLWGFPKYLLRQIPRMSLIFPFMIAVVEIGGKQHTVEQDMVIIVDRQAGDVGSIMTLPALLIASADGKTVKVGTPTVEGSQISFKIEEHLKADKIRVFKIKSKKRYMRTQGFRAYQTRLTVTAIA